jgi:hypothetical protein
MTPPTTTPMVSPWLRPLCRWWASAAAPVDVVLWTLLSVLDACAAPLLALPLIAVADVVALAVKEEPTAMALDCEKAEDAVAALDASDSRLSAKLTTEPTAALEYWLEVVVVRVADGDVSWPPAVDAIADVAPCSILKTYFSKPTAADQTACQVGGRSPCCSGRKRHRLLRADRKRNA